MFSVPKFHEETRWRPMRPFVVECIRDGLIQLTSKAYRIINELSTNAPAILLLCGAAHKQNHVNKCLRLASMYPSNSSLLVMNKIMHFTSPNGSVRNNILVLKKRSSKQFMQVLCSSSYFFLNFPSFMQQTQCHPKYNERFCEKLITFWESG